jgi:7-cyano-7-deazaguanine synthase
MMDADCVVILSGGLDSTVLLHHVVDEGGTPLAVTFDYGQKHRKEIAMARLSAEDLNIPHIVLSVPLDTVFSSSSLLSGGVDIPEGDYTVETQKSTVVPNRNMILLSYAIGIAEDRSIPRVYYGAHRNDRAVYPDCRPEFISALAAAAKAGTYNEVELLAPFMTWTKAQIVLRGHELGVPFGHTWSCYKGGETPCGRCGTCRERREAFRTAELNDPGES